MSHLWKSLLLTGFLLAGCAKSRLDAQVRELCAKDGGVKVYETVELPPEKFNQFGQINIPIKKDAKLGDNYYYEWEVTYIRHVDEVTDLARSHFKIYRFGDAKLLGESVAYTRRGADMPGPWHPSHFTCPLESGLVPLQQRIFSFNGDTK